MRTVSSKVRCIKVVAILAAIGGTAFTQSANAAPAHDWKASEASVLASASSSGERSFSPRQYLHLSF